MRSMRLKIACFRGLLPGKSNPHNYMRPIHRIVTGISTCASLVLIAGCASTDSFAKLDTNGDGAGSQPEFEAYMKHEVFNRVDSNTDGNVTLKEWQAFNPKVDKAKFSKADRNADGAITRPEADATFDREGSLKKLFTRIDADADGKLSRTETSSFREKVRQQPGNSPAEKISKASQP